MSLGAVAATNTAQDGVVSAPAGGSSSWANYVTLFLTRERQDVVEDSDQVKKLITLVSEAVWDELPTPVKLNVLRGYMDEKDPLTAMVESVKTIYAWRIKYQVKLMSHRLVSNFEAYQNMWPMKLAGEDVYGHPIIYDQLNSINFKALLEVGDEEMYACRTQALEIIELKKMEISKRTGSRVGKHIYILDLNGLVMSKHFSNSIQKKVRPLLKMSALVYPETLWSLWLINVPATFRLIWTAVRGWLEPSVRNKVRMFGSASKWTPAMNQTGISTESLPREFGGKVEGELLTKAFSRLSI